MAKVVRFHKLGGPEVLSIDDVYVPAPGPAEVRIAVTAFGLNRVEALFRSGGFSPPALPAKIGYEAAGIIDAVGTEVSGFAVGDRVATLPGLSMEEYGTYGESILYPANRLVHIHDTQSMTLAAATWMQYITAYALIDIGHVTTGDVVVINAASSSVGIAAIQIANDHGAISVAITRGRAKVEALYSCGAAHVIVSDEENVPARIMEITGGQGARIAFDAVAGQPLAGLLSAMAPLGVVIVYGMLAGHSLELMLPLLMLNNLTLRGFSADLLISQPESRANVIEYIQSGLARGALTPIISHTFDLAEIVQAHRYLESNTQLGKIVVTTGAARA